MWSALMSPSFLFLSFFTVGLAQNSGSPTDVNDSYPPFWDQISGDIAEFPVQNNKIIIDIWNYMNRLKMYKILLKKSSKYFVQFGQNNTGNVLWALTLFYGKLYKTGRFSDPSNTALCAYQAGSPGCLSINSAWGGINFYVIVVHFLAATESGFLGHVPHEIILLSQVENRSNFCYSIEECRASYPQVMDAATRFYQYLQSRNSLSIVGNSPVYNTGKETAIILMWEAHQTSVDVGKLKFSDISQYVSATERDFNEDFLTAIEFCEAAVYRSFFESSAEFLVGYPHRLLMDQDDKIFTSDFNTREKALLTSVRLISNINKATNGLLLTFWKKIMSISEVNQALGRFFIKRLLLIPIG